MKTLTSALIAAILVTTAAVAFAPSIPSWINDHSYLSDGEFYFDSYDASGVSDWNQQIISSWNDAAPLYCYEEDWQLIDGDYYLGYYNWSTQPFSLSEYINGLLMQYYTVPSVYVRIPYASYSEVCRGYNGLEQPCYPWMLAGQTNRRLKPKVTSGSVLNYIYKIDMLASAYAGGIPFRPGNEVWFGANLPSTSFRIAGRCPQSDNRFYMVLPGGSTTDITPLAVSTPDWYHYSVAATKIALSTSVKRTNVDYIDQAESNGYGINPTVRNAYINSIGVGDTRCGYHETPGVFFCFGFQMTSTVPGGMPACLQQGWIWHQDIQSRQYVWEPKSSNTLTGMELKSEGVNAPMLNGNDDGDLADDPTPDNALRMFMLDAPGTGPSSGYAELEPGGWVIWRTKGEAWLSWIDPVSGMQGIGTYQPWSMEIRVKKIGTQPTMVSASFNLSESLYQPLTLSQMLEIAGWM